MLTVTCITAVKCILPLLFESPSYNFYGNSNSQYDHCLCDPYFSNQLSKSLTFLTRTSLTTLIIILPSDTSPKEITTSRLSNKLSPVREIHSISKKQLFFLSEELNNIEEKRKQQRGNKVTEQRNRKCKEPQ